MELPVRVPYERIHEVPVVWIDVLGIKRIAGDRAGKVVRETFLECRTLNISEVSDLRTVEMLDYIMGVLMKDDVPRPGPLASELRAEADVVAVRHSVHVRSHSDMHAHLIVHPRVIECPLEIIMDDRDLEIDVRTLPGKRVIHVRAPGNGCDRRLNKISVALEMLASVVVSHLDETVLKDEPDEDLLVGGGHGDDIMAVRVR